MDENKELIALKSNSSNIYHIIENVIRIENRTLFDDVSETIDPFFLIIYFIGKLIKKIENQ
jgi:hypothetical protein